MRISDMLDLLTAGLTDEQLLEGLPELELADVQAALQLAAQRVNHPVLAA